MIEAADCDVSMVEQDVTGLHMCGCQGLTRQDGVSWRGGIEKTVVYRKDWTRITGKEYSETVLELILYVRQTLDYIIMTGVRIVVWSV